MRCFMFYLYTSFILSVLRECFTSMVILIPFGLIVVIGLFGLFKRLS